MSLERIHAGNWREALDVRVTDDQLPFVADHQPVALVILAKAYVGQGGHRWEPLLVRADGGEVVGVLALEHKAAEPCEIRNFAVDFKSQGRGIGTAATRAVLEWVSRDASDCVELAVSAHPANHAAHRTYQAAGFHWSGEHRGSEPLMRYEIQPTMDEQPDGNAALRREP